MQDTTYDADRATKDADDRLLWRRRPQRLEAEILRDAVLSVSGTLNPKPFGPAYKPPIPNEAMLARNTKDPYPKDARDTRFDPPAHGLHVPQAGRPASALAGVRWPGGGRELRPPRVSPPSRRRRWRSSTITFLRDRAADLARRLLAESEPTSRGWVTRGFELALSRPPSDAERAASVQFLETQLERRRARDKSRTPEEHRLRAVTDFAQALFSLNEFIYVD